MRRESDLSDDQATEANSHANLAMCRSIDWYAEAESRVVEVNGVTVTVRFIGRKGRRGRISIEAPAGAVFSTLDTERSKHSVNPHVQHIRS